MLHKNTPSRRILLRCFEFIAALRDHAINEEIERDRVLAKPIDEVFPCKFSDIPAFIKDRIGIASMRENIRLALAWRHHPESDESSTPVEETVSQAFAQLVDVLKLSLKDSHALVEQFAPAALLLRHSIDADSWFGLAKKILLFVTRNRPEENPVLRSLAPNRGLRKINREGKAKLNVKDIRDRIFDDMLEGPFKRIVGDAGTPPTNTQFSQRRFFQNGEFTSFHSWCRG